MQTTISHKMTVASICILDVGARLPLPKYYDRIENLSSIVAIEPDPQAANDVRRSLENSRFVEWDVCEVAIGATPGARLIYRCRNPNASSFYKVDPSFKERYGNSHWDEIDSFESPVNSIEALYRDTFLRHTRTNLPIILKVDIQGGEFDALLGARELLRSRVVAVIVEVDCIGAYELGPTFFRIGRLLERFGFSFFGFEELHFRSRCFRESGLKPRGSERIFWGNAIFFQDVHREQNRCRSDEFLQGLALAAFALDFLDFSSELLQLNPRLSKMIPEQILCQLRVQ